MFYRAQKGRNYKAFVDFRLSQQLNGLQKLVPVTWGCVSLKKLRHKGIPGTYTSPQWWFLGVFPRFTLFCTFSLKTSTFSPRRTTGTVTHRFPSFPSVRGYSCPNSGNATLDLRSTRAPTKENTKKHGNLQFL